jgi:hypothetical protein
MRELPSFTIGSAVIGFRLSDGRKIQMKFDRQEFQKMIDLLGVNNFNPKILVGTEGLYEIAKSNPLAKVIREYIPKK